MAGRKNIGEWLKERFLVFDGGFNRKAHQYRSSVEPHTYFYSTCGIAAVENRMKQKEAEARVEKPKREVSDVAATMVLSFLMISSSEDLKWRMVTVFKRLHRQIEEGSKEDGKMEDREGS